MYKFRKKPVVIEAFQMTESHMTDKSEWPGWLHAAWRKDMAEEGAVFARQAYVPGCAVYINTLEGSLLVNFNDYIIQGVQGELYPCKPDIFDETYDPVLETDYD